MSRKLDEELAQAAGLDESASPGNAAEHAPPVVKSVNSTGGRSRRNLALLGTLLVMGGSLVALLMVGFKDAAVYSTPVDQLMAQADKYVGRKVRVDGELVPGTLVKRDKPCEYRFTIHGKESVQLPVRYAQCVIPDTFRDVPSGGVQVTVEGTLKAADQFEASLVMAKCSSKYDPSTHKMDDKQAGNGMPVN